MTKKPQPVEPLDPAFVRGLMRIFEEQIPFNQVLGLKIERLEPGLVTGRIKMAPQLIGHFGHKRLHGGVISAGLDAMAGLAVMAAMGGKHRLETPEQQLQRFSKLGTIDLRIDYLRQATADEFELRAEVLRLGSRVATARMEFAAVGGDMVAVGAAAYIVS